MKDISLYGHLTIDTILDGNSEKKSLGSMANVWRSLLEIDSTLNIGLSPIDVGQALVYIDKLSAQRYSKANLNYLNAEFVFIRERKVLIEISFRPFHSYCPYPCYHSTHRYDP